MDCPCDCVIEEDFFQLGYSRDLTTMRIEFYSKLGSNNLEEVVVFTCVFTDKIGPNAEEGCPLPYITISKGLRNI